MEDSATRIRVGDAVLARGRRWRVREIRDYGSCRLFSLAGAEVWNQDIERRLLFPFDRIVSIPARRRARMAGSHAWPRLFRELVRTHVPAEGLQTAGHAEIELLPFQLEPALALIQGRGSRLLLADEVGLGKTIQAALAVAELRARGLADRVLVLAPAGLRDQWADELSRRFSIEGVVADARELRRRASLAPLGVNPWTTLDVAIASIDLVKRPDMLPPVVAAHWDLVIVDEAHAAASRSDRHAAVAAICQRAPYVLLLTATPHSGDRPAFESLCGLGSAGDDPLLVFRRSRRAVSHVAERRVHLLRVAPRHAERQLHERLSEFTRVAQAECGNGTNIRLAVQVLRKRAFSSPWSLSASVERRLTILGPDRNWPSQLALPLGGDSGEFDTDDEPPEWPMPALRDQRRERRLLEAIAVAARQAIECDSKLNVLTRLLRRLARRDERVIVFTEYRDTLDHVRRSLPLPTAVVHGGLGRSERREAVRAFGKGAARVLLATDAAGEGLNLQEGCRIVINLELPWNPNRLEQRIGRVDRIGQRHTVHAFHLIAAGVGEEGILTSLQQRLTRARHDIAVADPLATTMPEASDTAAVWTEPSSRVFPVIDPSSEFSRLSLLRALPRASGHENLAGPSGPAIALASRRLRARLRGALLAVVSSTLENSVGLRVAHRVSAVVLDCRTAMRRRLDHQQVDRLVANIERHFLRFDPDAGMWRERSRHTHLDLLTRRLAREREIEAAAARHAGALQAGLFDRRAERAADAAADQERLRREQSALRLAQLHRSMQLNDMISRVALILVP